MKKDKLVIFDCDGVLVESEILANRIVASEIRQYISEEWTEESFLRNFRGWPDRKITKQLTKTHGYSFPHDIHNKIVDAVDDALRKHLQAVDGMFELIRDLDCSVAVASNSPANRLNRSIEVAGLTKKFGRNVFSTENLCNDKPSPDIYNYVANTLKYPPKDCIVVEDSVSGVTAATNAKMHVLGFTQGKHCIEGDAERLINAGAQSIHSNVLLLKHELEQLTKDNFSHA